MDLSSAVLVFDGAGRQRLRELYVRRWPQGVLSRLSIIVVAFDPSSHLPSVSGIRSTTMTNPHPRPLLHPFSSSDFKGSSFGLSPTVSAYLFR